MNSSSEWCTPSRRSRVGREDDGGEGTPILAAGEGHRGTPGFVGGDRESGRVRGGRALRPSEKTAPISRLWPDFDDFRCVLLDWSLCAAAQCRYFIDGFVRLGLCLCSYLVSFIRETMSSET